MIKQQEKEKYIRSKKQKKGGKTNNMKKKNKPMGMVIGKKRLEQHVKNQAMNKKIKNLKVQLGRFKRGNMVLKKKGQNNKQKRKMR